MLLGVHYGNKRCGFVFYSDEEMIDENYLFIIADDRPQTIDPLGANTQFR